ncbi:MAG: ABC transporter permease subunit [Pirellulales bacterium]
MTTSPTLSTDETSRSESGPSAATVPTSRVRACWTLYWLTLRQHLHGRRWMAVALLFLLPAGMAILFRTMHSGVPSLFLEFVLLWILIPQALLPLVALLYGSGIIQDEQEDQTITYLLIRPLPKWLIYWTKMAATWTTTVLLVVLLTALTDAAIYAASGADLRTALLHCLQAAAILSLAAIAYCSLFGAISLLTKRTLIVGILYVALVEGLLASFPLSLRWATVIYYTRLMAYHTLDFVVTWPRGKQDDVAAAAWFLNTDSDPTLAEHPQFSTCVLVLLGVSLSGTAVAGWLCSRREFHVKTPEKE